MVDPMPCRPTWMAGFFSSPETVKGKKEERQETWGICMPFPHKRIRRGDPTVYIRVYYLFPSSCVTDPCVSSSSRGEKKKGQCCVVLCWLCMKEEEESKESSRIHIIMAVLVETGGGKKNQEEERKEMKLKKKKSEGGRKERLLST